MGKVFVPYVDDQPAAVEVNGHRLLILTSLPEDMAEDLELLGGSEIREVQYSDEDTMLVDLAANINGGVVLAPPGTSPRSMIDSLSAELPWIH